MNLADARKGAGLTQVQAAEKIGVSDSAIAQWETGRTSPKINKWRQIAEAYGLTPNQVFSAVVESQMEAYQNAGKGQGTAQGE